MAKERTSRALAKIDPKKVYTISEAVQQLKRQNTVNLMKPFVFPSV